MTSFQSQLLGVLLATTTAVGILAYEKLVKSLTYFSVGFLVSLSYVPFFMCAMLIQNPVLKTEWNSLWQQKGALTIFMLSGATGPLWYFITKNQGAAVGAIYEVKYIVVMAILYLFFGEAKMTMNTMVGICLATASVYFISK